MPTRPEHLRAILALAAPIFLGQIAVTANTVADTIMAGHYGPEHLAAVGIGNSLYVTVFVPLMGMMQGLSPLAARAHGAQQPAEIGRYTRQAVLVALAVTVPGLLALLFPGLLLQLAGVPESVAPLAGRYLRITALGLPAILLARVFFALAPAVGHPGIVMAINVATFLAKIPLSYALLYGRFGLPEMGAPGCALASAIVYWMVLAVSASLLLRHPWFRALAILRGRFLPERRPLLDILRIGTPIALSVLVEVTAYTFMALFLARLGPTVSAAHQIIANLGALLYMFPLSVGIASQILVAQSIGARRPEAAMRIAASGIACGFGSGLAVAIALLALRAPIVALYSSDAAVRALAVTLLPLLAFYHFWDAIQAVTMQTLRGYHRNFVPMLLYAATLWGIGLPGGYWLAFSGLPALAGTSGIVPQGAAGFWTFAALSLMVACIGLLAYLRMVVGQDHDPAAAA